MANQEEDPQENENNHLREEFRQLIVPLLHKSLHDKPTDVTRYCARYFQELLEERQKRSASGNENEKIQQSKIFETGEKAQKRERVPQVQESTSLPALTDTHRNRLSLRETSSWNSPSDSSSMPCRLWDISCDVADAMSFIGDHPNKNMASEGTLNTESSKAKSADHQFFFGDEGNIENRKKCIDNQERNVYSSTLESSKSSLIDDDVLLPFDKEVKEELSTIINSSSSSTDITSGTTHRKQWSSNVDSKSDLKFKTEFAATHEDEEELSPDISSKQCFQKDDTVESATVSRESITLNTSFGPIPQLKELASLAETKESSTPFVQNEIESSVKLVSQSLQELVKVLDSMKSFCNENLQRIKTLSEILPEKSQPAPRKKRSVTTFSSSDNLAQSKEFLKGPRNKISSFAINKGCSKISQKLMELKISDCEAELDSHVLDYRLKGKKVEEEIKCKEIAPIKEINASKDKNLNFKKGSSLDKKLVISDSNTKQSKSDSKDTCVNEKYFSKGGIVNKGFVIDDNELRRKNHRQGQQQYHGQNSWHINGYRRRILNEQSPFSQIKISKPCSGGNANFSRPHSQIYRQMPESRFSYIGEGGDVFSTSQGQCSVATETDAIHSTERAGTSDGRISTVRIQPVSNGNSEQEASASQEAKDENEKHVSVNELLNHKSSLNDEESSKLSDRHPVQIIPSVEGTTALTGEKTEAQENKADLKPSKKSSSLNPCAECFNPTSKLVQNLEAWKSLVGNETPYVEQGSSDFTKAPEDLSIISFPEVDADWDYEMFENDFLLQDQEPILYQNVDSDGYTISLTLEEIEDQHNFENDVCNAEFELLDEVNYSQQKNGSTQERDRAFASEKKEHSKKHNRKSDLKLAEGDQGLEDVEEEAERSDSAEKQEEPGLNSACGDFVASENNNEREENPGDDSGNVQMVAAAVAIDFDMGIPGLQPLNADDRASQNRRQEEEMELNFACFSGSDSSEIESSDISEEEDEFSAEKEETKVEEKV
ncbi:hypothetical protein HNY73_017056 [Argiope bruennichi]|uniref:RIIa domain-containing protein n=1 Tax=Argiope bruennichi TaxID=94029 RepID=A0A8T0EPC9_ARGBR|nr:hypothetical protein HNY73_017056 [Argiope bruennichi]